MLFRPSILNLHVLSHHNHKAEKLNLKWSMVMISQIYNQWRISFSKATTLSERLPPSRDQVPKYLHLIGDISHSSQPLCNWKILQNPVCFNGKHTRCMRTDGIKQRIKRLRIIQKVMVEMKMLKRLWVACWRVTLRIHTHPFPATQLNIIQTLQLGAMDQYLLAGSFLLRLTQYLPVAYQELSSHHTWSHTWS